MRKTVFKKNVLALLLAVAMVLGMMPQTIYASKEDTATETLYTEEQSTEVVEEASEIATEQPEEEALTPSAQEKNADGTGDGADEEAKIQVTVSAYDYTAKDAGIAGASATGVIFENQIVEVDSTEAIANVVKAAAEAASVDCEVVNGSYGPWITSINGLGTDADHSWSGWSYCLNKDYNNYILTEGTTIDVSYTVDGGTDINNGYDYVTGTPAAPKLTAFSIKGKVADLGNLSGAGTKEDPYVITVDKGSSNVDVSSVKAAYQTTLNGNYVVFDTSEDGMKDISGIVDYSTPVNFCLAGRFGTMKTYYQVQTYADSVRIWQEMIHDYTLPTPDRADKTYTWTSSNPDVIVVENGVAKITRPAIGTADAWVTLTLKIATESAEHSVDYQVYVPARQDTTTDEGRIKEATYVTREHYLENRKLTQAWEVWAAYSALGTYIQDPDNGYTFPEINTSKVPEGKELLQIVAQGDNPYNYQGVNLIEKKIEAGLGGRWSAPIFNMLAIEAAGADCEDSVKQSAIENSIAQMKALTWGPDMGGWGAVVAARHLDDSYAATSKDAIEYFIENLKDRMYGNSTGSKGLSIGCVTTGFTALHQTGYPGVNVIEDENWTKQDAIKTMYDLYIDGEDGVSTNWNVQYMMEFCDMYNTFYANGNVGWISCGVDRTKLAALEEKAHTILNESYLYTAETLAEVQNTLAAAESISAADLGAKNPTYGAQYYALYDAVRYVQVSGEDSDDAVAEAFMEAVNALPEVSAIQLKDEAAIQAVRNTYEAMTAHQKGKISKEILAKLSAAEAQIIILKRLGLTLTGSNADIYRLEVARAVSTSASYKALSAKVTTGKLLSVYDIQVFDEDTQKYLTGKIQGATLNIPVADAAKYAVLFCSTDGKVSYVKPTVKSGVASVALSQAGTYAVAGYSVPTMTSVTVKRATHTSVKISWDKVGSATGYSIYRATSKNGSYSKVATVSTTSYTNKKLSYGKTYYYKVKANVSLYGQTYTTAYSSVKSIKVPAKVAAVKVKVASTTYDSIRLSWNKASGAKSYTIYRASSKKGKYTKLATVKTTSYTNKKLKAGKTWYYKVKASGTLYREKYTTAASNIVSAKAVPAKPVIKLSAGKKKATVTWNKISGANGYEVYRATSKNGKYTKAATVKAGKTTYTDKKLKAKKTYYYKVRAYKTVKGKKVYTGSSSVGKTTTKK